MADNRYRKSDVEKLEETTEPRDAATRLRLDEDPSLNAEIIEYAEQLDQALQGPQSRFNSDTAKAAQDDQYYEFPDQPEASCSTSKDASCWNFDCSKLPLSKLGSVNAKANTEPNTSAKNIVPINIGADFASVFGIPPTDTHEKLPVDLSYESKKGEAINNLPTTTEFVRENPTYVTSGSTPVQISHDEIMSAMNGFTNMFLAHEISVNDNFSLENFMPAQDSLESRVRTQMKRAFWDKFDETFKGNPPNYNHALLILGEIKHEMIQLLLPHQRRIKAHITDTIDVDQIKRQIQNNAFDPTEFHRIATYVIGTLGDLCCPARDPDIRALRELQSGHRIFRGILEVIEKMRLDMANFMILQSRPLIIKQSVHYERTKFAEFLELEYRLGHDGLNATRLWLMRHKEQNRCTRMVISKAFGELLNYNASFAWPEVVTMDITRIQEMEFQLKRLALIGACILSVGVAYQVMFTDRFVHEVREISKKHLKMILSINDMKEPKKTSEAVLRIAEELCAVINQLVVEKMGGSITEGDKQAIRKCVHEINDPEHKILNLMFRRISEYVDEVVCARWSYPVSMPPGLATVHHELHGTLSQFYRLINHVRRVYGPILNGIIDGEIVPPVYPDHLNGERDPKFSAVLQQLRRDYVEDENEARDRREDVRRVHEAQSQLPDGIA